MIWTDKEVAILKENWGAIDRSEIARMLGKSETACSIKAMRMGLSDKRIGRPKPDTSPRRCMNPDCNKEFRSAGNHNRFCGKCGQRSVGPFEESVWS